MPDLKTALQNALSKTQQDSVNTALLNAWDKDTADSKAQQGESTVPTKTFPITSNISRNLFNFVRANPGCQFHVIKESLKQHNPNSLGSLLTQMIKNNMLRREGTHLHYNYFTTVPEYVPIKTRSRKMQKAQEAKKKVVTIVRPKIKDSVVPSTAGLAALKVDTRADDIQVSGNHYKDMPVQPWHVMESVLSPEEFRGFLRGNVIKYSLRAGRKEGSDDAGKAQHYMMKLKEFNEKMYKMQLEKT